MIMSKLYKIEKVFFLWGIIMLFLGKIGGGWLYFAVCFSGEWQYL